MKSITILSLAGSLALSGAFINAASLAQGSGSTKIALVHAQTQGRAVPTPTAKAEIRKRCSNPEEQRQDLEKQRKQLQEKIKSARQKEQKAFQKLNKIKTMLNQTSGALQASTHKLEKTTETLKVTATNLEQTKNQTGDLSHQATARLREIYEGQRINLVEMLFQVDSLQGLLDLFYYQERIMEADRKLLAELKARENALAMKKNKLDVQKDKLGNLVSEFASRVLQMNKEKLNQEQTAQKLRSQRAFYEQAEKQLAEESQRLESQIVQLEHSSRKSNKEVLGSGSMSMPLHAPVTSPFGWRRHPIFGLRKYHTGVDLAGPNRSNIRAADSGTVLYTGWYAGYGKVVIVGHGKSMSTLYAHLSHIQVSTGDTVQKGQIVGNEGTTGFSTGPHLHFEVRVNGKPNNPLNYVR